jgi:hypothetical protein
MKWKIFSALMCLALARVAGATDTLYENWANLYYVVPGNPPPTIDATNFVNESTFSVTFSTLPAHVLTYYEPLNTRNYTNIDTMIVNGPLTNDGWDLTLSLMVGLVYDTQTNAASSYPHVMAGTFYNSGTIRCDSIIDGNNLFTFDANDRLIPVSIGQCYVTATNIINPGSIISGMNGLMQFTGQNVDLDRTVLMMEGVGQNDILGNLGLAGYGGFGVDTNGDWAPYYDLGPTHAYSSWPFYITLNNSTPYYAIEAAGTNAQIIRAVFIQNQNTNIPYNVYFGPVNYPLGSGEATVEWIGTFVDPATGTPSTKYLYLNDDYVQNASTNNFLYNGYPYYFTFTQSGIQIPIGTPAGSGFPSGYFTAGSISNWYAYVDAQMIASTVATNDITNPTGSITNMPGRVQITASRQLQMNLAQITGIDYLNLMATNQFDGSAGALIRSPYADINLAVTNGFMTVSNLLEAAIPNWGGMVQAWSTRWTEVNTNYGYPFTNDFRVMIVYSDLQVTEQPQVQNLRLHATNSLVITDLLNVYGSLYIDAQSLTLATNLFGFGATSPDGELNIGNNNILWPSALPYLRWLTNNGALRIGNLGVFGSDAVTYTTNTTPGTPAIAATGTLSELLPATNVVANSRVTIGTNQYAFVKVVTNTVPNQIKIAPAFDGTMSNLIAAINRTSNPGSKFSSSTLANPFVTAGLLSGHAFIVKARTAGAAGNSIVTTTTSTNLTWNSSATLSGGADAVPATTNITSVGGHYGAFINNSLIMSQGATIYADNFLNCSVISNGVGSFVLYSQTATLTNGVILADGDISITADTLIASNVMLRAKRGLTLQVTNELTDGSVTNGNIWSVGNPLGTGGKGLALPVKPVRGDLLGTTITNYAPGPNKKVNNTWAGLDRGISTNGYTSNAALGHLILDAGTNALFQFNGVGRSNALYVDYLDLRNQATNRDANGNVQALGFSTNTASPGLVIYYARATAGGLDIAQKINGKNTNHLRWVSNYVGYFSYTNFVFAGMTSPPVNISLALSSLDSDGDGVANGSDPIPFWIVVPGFDMIQLQTVQAGAAMWLTWNTVPNATNTVLYTTDLVNYQVLPSPVIVTKPAGSVVAATPASFVLTFTNGVHASPVPVTVADPLGDGRYYRVRVDLHQ